MATIIRVFLMTILLFRPSITMPPLLNYLVETKLIGIFFAKVILYRIIVTGLLGVHGSRGVNWN